MKERILAAIAALIIVLPILIWGGLWGFFGLLAVAVVIATNELKGMIFQDSHHLMLPVHFIYLLSFAGFSFLRIGNGSVLAPAAILLWLIAMFGEKDNEKGLLFASRASFGLIYIPLLLSYFVHVRSFDHGLQWVFLVLLITWSADTGAYFAGRFLGKNKLFPRVSPKKTIEGVVGGVFLSMIVSVAYSMQWLPEVSTMHALILGSGLALLSVVGDLVESMVKRATGVKDSGTLMPGHGGIVDRLDSLLFTFPATYFYVQLCMANSGWSIAL